MVPRNIIVCSNSKSYKVSTTYRFGRPNERCVWCVVQCLHHDVFTPTVGKGAGSPGHLRVCEDLSV